MTCGNGHTTRHRTYPDNIIGSSADPLQSDISCSPSPPLAEPYDEAVEPLRYRDGKAAWTASGDAVWWGDVAAWGDAATEGDMHGHAQSAGRNMANGDDIAGQY